MKKALLAGTVSLAVAAMPVVGVFAADTTTQTDHLSVTIAKSCTMSSVNHTDGDNDEGTWGASDDTLSVTMAAGTYDEDFGATTFNIFCNNTSGWKVTAKAAANLTTGADDIPLVFSPIANANASGYTVTSEGTGITSTGIMTSAEQIVAQDDKETVNAGVNFTVKYAVAVADGQAAGTYIGDVVYTLAEL